MKRLDERGETLVEVVMALAILSLVLVSSYALATGTFRLGRGAGERTQAVNYLQEQAEALRTYRNEVDWDIEFRRDILPYVSSTNSFCMVKSEVLGVQRWRPVNANSAACTIGGVAITVKATSEDINSQQYRFDFKAIWNVGPQENNVTLTTKLTDQTP